MTVLRPTPPRGDRQKNRNVRTEASPQPENTTLRGGSTRSGFARSGFPRSEFARSGFARSGFARSGFARSGLDRSGLARSGFARSGLARSGFARSGFQRSGMAQSGRSSRKRGITRPIFNRLTGVWVQRSGVPFNTTGFVATVSRGNVIVDTAFFDPFGVVRFNNIRTLTIVTLTLRVFNRNGILFRTRRIPPGVETFAIIG